MSIDRLRIEAVIARGEAAVSVPDVTALAAQLSAAIRRGVTFETKRYVIERLDVRGRTRILDDGRRALDVSLTLPGAEESHTLIVSPAFQTAGHNARRPTLATTLPLPPPGMRGRHTSGRYVSAR